MNSDIKSILEVARNTALKAGALAVEIRRTGNIDLQSKSATELVTIADKKSEAIIIQAVKEAFPDHSFLSEETNSSTEGKDFLKPMWIIDPIDGTTNYAHDLQFWAVSIAYAENGVVQAGVVYAPLLNELFYATKGNGAYLNEKPIKVSARQNLNECLVATGFPYERDSRRLNSVMENSRKILEACRDIRRYGAASLDISYVACGRMDIFYEDLSPWDMAAAGLIAREAGALIGNWKEDPYNAPLPEDLRSKGFVVANSAVFEPTLKILKNS